MTSWLEELDPDVRHVLEDVARQDGALLKLDPSAPSIDPLEEGLQISWTAPGLASAERHLLRAHREELWLLLHRAFRLKKLGDPMGLAKYPDSVASVGLSPSEMRRKAKRLRTASAGPRALLEVIADGDLSILTYAELARSARLILDSDSSRLLVAVAETLNEGGDEALRISTNVGMRAIRTDIRVSGLTIAALAQEMLGYERDALMSIEQALQLDPGDPDCWSSRLLLSLRVGDWARCVESGRGFERLWPAASANLSSLIATVRTRSRGHWRMSPFLPEGVVCSLGPAALELIHGITS